MSHKFYEVVCEPSCDKLQVCKLADVLREQRGINNLVISSCMMYKSVG